MPSFDVVCRTDLAELDNAVNGVGREVRQRFDLKGTDCLVERSGDNLIINADNDMLLRQMHDLIRTYCGKRGVDSKVLDFKKPQTVTKGTLRQEVAIRQGIEDSMCRQIVKMVKGKKLKVQVTIQGSELRVNGKKRDDLQETIEAIKEMNLDVPLQYVNFRD
ncbi:MAG: hypothetical protein DK304_000468 [Chloroflexi bacterium]|jgi:uncharacterized protein YajQ (UPF0234 family)|nr:MAG: hypothetical protein DK304_000468 [Chloroflexota bacterium]